VKSVGSGEFAHEVRLYRVDTALVREIRDTLKQIAIEAGQWAEKREVTGAGGGPIEVTALTPQQRAQRVADLLAQGMANVDSGGD